MTSNLEDQLLALRQEGETAIAAADSLERLEELRVNYLGKKGQLGLLLRSMGQMSAEERPQIGAIANTVKEAIQNSLDQQRTTLESAQILVQLEAETIDVTMPGIYRPQGRIHPLNGIIDQTLDIFVGMGYTVAQGSEMETDYYNFEALNTPPDHPARDMQDTFYLPDGNLLRTHTSSVQIRYMEKEEPPIRVVAPGRVYRRDDVDATHSAVFHQIELLAIDEGLTFTDLKGTVKIFLQSIFGDLPIRFRASYFPFTEPSAEVDLQWKGRWLEVMGCGMVDPNVLKSVGYDPEVYSGFAAGFGVERFAMVLHQIDDIRRLYNSDLRFLQQF
ncbi:phenylalanine--tRNA ligase subunit alpha [Dolichospermum sp. UHCC 0684]|jgi:phenylalanyl-tRNA synthetase alpha chain|uniref:Phenylalanine--tRNA ligase alpha subunit n=1 Tax=Dolichospermum flos-aquae CCAP 1403/13F TaxID=315271 RepID=A0A6H2C507_DOLFA|nr:MULTISPECIES: phenylalanine--tRNA ligase subunit alpha [Nostocales]MBO1054972.1 phenylalanine--tRNA ligase subunit alpha [Dolichospermum sp. DET73]MBO1058976.1 phenylalanine--tRNA ligase subunit alpha [Dolichospermum sp. JUN01]MBS9382745.1 phenylalanine--tRNA ligase subunit alpha [Dolichospermum sp. BR01]MBS9387413.1 phenylalanine--tRNA ligase subunit alpha [Dolichospermum sp. WA123]OBQ14314.1 MAG: phenylalanyl-tRNA synthetase [Anabaena sp. LE011-02]OBQ38230.1 MAG: phenylalanyl-tRNA synthe